MLARSFEQAGISTILITMMPVWAEKAGVARTLAVEHPFGQTLGKAGDVAGQLKVIERSLQVLEEAATPGHIEHWPETWSGETGAVITAWQPKEPSPIVAHLQPRFREILRQRRKSSQS